MQQKLMARRSFLALAAAVGAGVLTGCGTTGGHAVPGGSSTGNTDDSGQELRGDAARMAAAPAGTATENLCRFAAELFAASAPGTDNAVISPYSVLAAVGMAEFAADDAALKAMTEVLGGDAKQIAAQVTAVDEAVAAAVAASADVAEDGETEPAVVTPANSLFVQAGTELRQEFLDALASGYDAGLFTTDFRGDPESARQQINAWVSDKTRELIPELLAEGTVTDEWRLALVNALYLKAQWAEELGRRGGTYSFTTASGDTVEVDELTGSGRHLDYATGDGWQAVNLPYVGGDLVMTILLPEAGAFEKVAASLDGPTLAAACSGEDREVDLTLPPFDVDFGVELTDPLKGMGMEPAFDVPLPGAGTSDDGKPLVMTTVIHQAKISVDEHGTEAAAATVVAMEAGAAPGPSDPPVEFTVDRPFLYAISDTTTKCPLFLGRITDPTA